MFKRIATLIVALAFITPTFAQTLTPDATEVADATPTMEVIPTVTPDVAPIVTPSPNDILGRDDVSVSIGVLEIAVTALFLMLGGAGFGTALSSAFTQRGGRDGALITSLERIVERQNDTVKLAIESAAGLTRAALNGLNIPDADKIADVIEDVADGLEGDEDVDISTPPPSK